MAQEKKDNEKEIFAEFMSLTNEERDLRFGFHLQKEFGEKFKVSEKTLCEWKKSASFERMRKKMIKNAAGNGLKEVIRSLQIRAEDGDVQAIKLYLEYLGELIKKQEISVSTEDVEIFLEKIMNILLKHLKNYPEILSAIQNDIAAIEDDEE